MTKKSNFTKIIVGAIVSIFVIFDMPVLSKNGPEYKNVFFGNKKSVNNLKKQTFALQNLFLYLGQYPTFLPKKITGEKF